MINVDEIIKAITIILYTPFVAYEKPVSAMLIANPEQGKTEILKKFCFNEEGHAINSPQILCLPDFTKYALIEEYGKELKEGNIKIIICPEFLNVISKKKDSVNGTIAFLNSLTEEGVSSIKSYVTNIEFDPPLRCSFLTAITKNQYYSNRKLFGDYGFLSRVLPLSYEYTEVTQKAIFDSVINQEYHSEKPIILPFPKEKVKVKLDRKFSRKIHDLVLQISTKNNFQGVRLQKIVQCLMKASALMDNRDEVSETDYDNICNILNWINYGDKPKQI